MFGINKKEWLSTFLDLEYGIPDACTFRNAIKEIDVKKRPLHVVSVFSHEYGLIMGQLACEEKSNEITAIPKLLEINGCIITIDAMGHRKKLQKKLFQRMPIIFCH